MEARAKINLTLEILGVRTDGYHDIRSLVMPVSLSDVVSFSPSDGISLDVESSGDCDISKVGPVEGNLAYRAALLLKRETGCGDGARIRLVKRIPAGAGLGGGSADAAAVLNGLNDFWNLGIARDELAGLGAELGCDVPALVLGGCVLMEGRGERVAREPSSKSLDLVLAFPDVFTSTAEVYRHCVPQLTNGGQIVDNMRHALSGGEVPAVAAALYNGLSAAAESLHPGIAHARRALAAAGARGSSMSGSGSCVFGLARDAGHAEEIARRLAEAGLKARTARTCPVM